MLKKSKSLFNIKIGFSMVLFGIIWIISGNGVTFLTVCFVVLLHEFIHGLTAVLLGLEVEKIVLYPFGGGIFISGIDDFPEKEIIISAVAPLFSVFSGLLWQKGTEIGLTSKWDEFVSYSYTLGFFNLIPAYPLDGGRISEGIFTFALGKKGRKFNKIISLATAVCFFLFNLAKMIFYNNFGFVFMGLFVLISSVVNFNEKDFKFRKHSNSNKIRLILGKKNEPLLKIYNRFYGEDYCFAVIVDENGKTLKMLGEEEIENILIENSAAKA